MGLFSTLRDMVQNAQNRNEKNPNVKTADKTVFEDLTNKFKDFLDKDENVKEKTTPKKETTVSDVPFFYEDLVKKVEEVKVNNEVNPEVETADKSVFEDLMKEIENLKKQAAENKMNVSDAGQSTTTTTYQNEATATTLAVGMQITANGMGGSLQLRMNPDMGAAINSVLVPDQSKLRILQFSDKAVHLDGKISKFVLVDYDGQQGWILDSYLGMGHMKNPF